MCSRIGSHELWILGVVWTAYNQPIISTNRSDTWMSNLVTTDMPSADWDLEVNTHLMRGSLEKFKNGEVYHEDGIVHLWRFSRSSLQFQWLTVSPNCHRRRRKLFFPTFLFSNSGHPSRRRSHITGCHMAVFIMRGHAVPHCSIAEIGGRSDKDSVSALSWFTKTCRLSWRFSFLSIFSKSWR
jgi:hypothetical protein